jgi:hypothetical protein
MVRSTSSILKSALYIPEVAHRLQDLIVKLNGARDEQCGVGCLLRHFDGRFCFNCSLWCRCRLSRFPRLGDVALLVYKARAPFGGKWRI